MRRLSTAIAPLVNRLRGQLFPPACLFCGEPLAAGEHCCADCLPEIAVWPREACGRCGQPLPGELVPGPCGHCLKRPPFQQATVSLFAYKGPVRDAILEWKLQGRPEGVRWLVDTAAVRLAELIAPQDLLLPVPMPLSRMRKSGQHHAADLCRMLARHAGCRWDWRLLRRIGEQPRQSELPASERRKNLRKAFAVDADHLTAHGSISGRVWVVDDILTTGTTLGCAARVLKPVKAPVHALSLARTPTR